MFQGSINSNINLSQAAVHCGRMGSVNPAFLYKKKEAQTLGLNIALLLLSAVGIVLFMVLMIAGLGNHETGFFSANSGEGEYWDSRFYNDSSANIAERLSASERKHFGAQVHYVSELIRKTGTVKDPYKLAFKIVGESWKADYDPILISSIILAESTFRHKAKSSIGALGLMQLRPSTAQYISKKHKVVWRGTDSLYEPAYNVRLGIAYLDYLKKKYSGDLHKALVAYNWGPGNLRAASKGLKTIPGMSLNYSSKIRKKYRAWNYDFGRKETRYQNMPINWNRG